MGFVRKCDVADFEILYEIINEAAEAYRDVIPADRWHEPYMSCDELAAEIADGVQFWGYVEEDGVPAGVMGIQDRGDVALIRHAYVRASKQRRGIGGKLMGHLARLIEMPILVGTWAAAHWAVAFYQSHGYRLVTPEEKDRLLRKYWSIPERQVETSVVLADARWREGRRNPTQDTAS